MASCELCGKTATTKAKVEGTILSVCSSCAAFGTEIKSLPKPAARQMRARQEPETYIIENAGHILRKARQNAGLTEEDAAKRLGMHKSTLLHFEAGKMLPDDATLKKLEKFYGVSLQKQL